MAKIRGIKPEYWTDEDIVELSIPARLLFIGMWNFACDNGHLDDKPKQIKMRVLPADDVNVEELLEELVTNGRIIREKGTITILKFAQHQKPHSRWWTTCDRPDCVKPTGSTTVDDGSARTPDNGGPTVVTSGQRVTTAVLDGDGDGECEVDGELTRVGKPAAFDEWWDAYPRKVGKGQARKAYTTAAKKTDPATLLSSLLEQIPTLTRKGPEFTPHPATWLNGERWADEADNAVDNAPKSGDSADWMRRRPGNQAGGMW